MINNTEQPYPQKQEYTHVEETVDKQQRNICQICREQITFRRDINPVIKFSRGADICWNCFISTFYPQLTPYQNINVMPLGRQSTA